MARLHHRPVAASLGVGLACLTLVAAVACVGIDSSRAIAGAVQVGAGPSGPGMGLRLGAGDDRRIAALSVAVPGARPRIEPLRRGPPNAPYEIGDERYVPTAQDLPMRQSGIASWYGEPFHGRQTATGEIYDMNAMTAAHPTMPLPSYALVRHVASGRQVIVRVNDRGPFVGGRVIDLSRAAAQRLGIEGIARVEVVRLTHDDIRQGRWTDPAVRLASADLVPRP